MKPGRKRRVNPPQSQRSQPGQQWKMHPRPETAMRDYRAAGRLVGQVALITGGDSGIGRAVATAFAKEGADIAIAYLSERRDAAETVQQVEQQGRRCLSIRADLTKPASARQCVAQVRRVFKRLDVLVNNAAMHVQQDDLEDITPRQLQQTFATNVFATFYVTQAALRLLPKGGRIINTASVVAYRGSPKLIDYAATKGAMVAFTRSLALSLVTRGIRVNAVAPGPVWTPLIPATLSPREVSTFGSDVPLGRPAQPDEIAPCFVFLASDDAVFLTGQVLHPNGGEIVNA